MFTRQSVPEEIVSDNGTVFISTALKEFAMLYNLRGYTMPLVYPCKQNCLSSKPFD